MAYLILVGMFVILSMLLRERFGKRKLIVMMTGALANTLMSLAHAIRAAGIIAGEVPEQIAAEYKAQQRLFERRENVAA